MENLQNFTCVGYSKMEIPSSDSFLSPMKKGFLKKLTNRGWLYSGTWKSRFCILDGTKLYFYEKEHSKGNEKSAGVINLIYYDVCDVDESHKDKKHSYVFNITPSIKGFFDSRHQFASESDDDLQCWMGAVKSAIAQAHSGKKNNDLSLREPSESEVACLVSVAKDRAKGPKGRRLPQRKSMMPPTASHPEGMMKWRQRSTSFNSSIKTNPIEEEHDDTSYAPGDRKRLSQSMHDVDSGQRDDDISLTDDQRSSSVFDLPQENEPQKKTRPNLLSSHAAITRELEMRLKAGKAPASTRRLHSETEEEAKGISRSLTDLATSVDDARNTLDTLEQRVSTLTTQVEAANEKNLEASTKIGDLLLQVTATLQEAERINSKCQRALNEANTAKTEYQVLVKECKETLIQLNKPQENGV